MGTFIAQIWAAISGYFKNGLQVLASDVWSVLQAIGGTLGTIIQDVWNALGGLRSTLEGVFKQLWKWIGQSVHWLLHSALPTIQQWINKIRQKLSKLLHPIIAWLQAWKKAWNQYYQNVLRPVINLIQRLRSILVVFRMLHIGWATRLDNYLVGAENKIQQAFFQVEQQINQLLNWTNWVLDPTGLFQPVTYVMSAIQTAGQMLAVLWGAQNQTVDPATAAAQKQMAQSGLAGPATAAAKDVWGNGLSEDQIHRQTQISTLYGNDGWRPWGK